MAVIGGGNVAIDAVRTALRCGSKKPFIIYRRSEAEMPAGVDEIAECREKGIEMMTLTTPNRIIAENGRVKAIECLKMKLGEPDNSGRRFPQPIDGSAFTIQIDALVPAIGQESDWVCLTEECYQCVTACLAGAVDHQRQMQVKTIEVGGIILAPGFVPYDPTPYQAYNYAIHPNVVTSLEFERMLSASGPYTGHLVRPSDNKPPKKIAWLQCVGSRDINHCDKKSNPRMKIYILYQDIHTYGFREKRYQEARQALFLFVMSLNNNPVWPWMLLTINDHVLRRPIRIKPDLLVLATGIVPNDNQRLFELFKVPVNADGFLVEAHAKLRPVEFVSEGIFLAGLAHYPKPLEESIAQAKATASRAMTVLAKEALKVGGIVASVALERCAACLTCVRTCHYSDNRFQTELLDKLE